KIDRIKYFELDQLGDSIADCVFHFIRETIVLGNLQRRSHSSDIGERMENVYLEGCEPVLISKEQFLHLIESSGLLEMI
ncbi:hypothetical protein PMAYCL1PPCAC_25515, partial [Pristionchus mayeri]